jgi:hypothetical protein
MSKKRHGAYDEGTSRTKPGKQNHGQCAPRFGVFAHYSKYINDHVNAAL